MSHRKSWNLRYFLHTIIKQALFTFTTVQILHTTQLLLHVQIKYHSFPVPVSENETGKFYFFLPNFETENLFSKNYSRKPETFLGKTETIFGKPGKPISLSVCLSLWLSVCLSLLLWLSVCLSQSLTLLSHITLTSHNRNG